MTCGRIDFTFDFPLSTVQKTSQGRIVWKGEMPWLNAKEMYVLSQYTKSSKIASPNSFFVDIAVENLL